MTLIFLQLCRLEPKVKSLAFCGLSSQCAHGWIPTVCIQSFSPVISIYLSHPLGDSTSSYCEFRSLRLHHRNLEDSIESITPLLSKVEFKALESSAYRGRSGDRRHNLIFAIIALVSRDKTRRRGVGGESSKVAENGRRGLDLSPQSL